MRDLSCGGGEEANGGYESSEIHINNNVVINLNNDERECVRFNLLALRQGPKLSHH